MTNINIARLRYYHKIFCYTHVDNVVFCNFTNFKVV